MARTMGQRMADQRTALVGRGAELAFLRGLLEDDGPVVAFTHGIGGVGKSALIEAFNREALEGGAIVVRLDGDGIEPTTRGFAEAITGETGAEMATAEEAAARIARSDGRRGRVVLVIDGYGRLRPIDTWIRQTFVPLLDDQVRVVIADRDPPAPDWTLTMGQLFASLAVGNLPRADAEELLRREGVDDADAARINRLARGHPLSLRLAAASLAARPMLDHDTTTVTTMVEELTGLYLGGLDPLTRVALDAACIVRRPTLSLLGAMLPDADPQAAFERLRTLPFVELGTDGLVVHDTIREVVAAYLRASDPDRSRQYRTAAWRQLQAEIATAGAQGVGRHTAALLYLLENPVIREAFFPTSGPAYTVGNAQAGDWAAILRITHASYPGAPTVDLEAWWTYARPTFRIARDGAGALAGFVTISDPARLPREVLNVDPVARRWRDDLRRRPILPTQLAIGYRMERAHPDDPAGELVHAALVLEAQRTWMEMGPTLRRHYSVSRTLATHESAWTGVEFEAVGEPLEVDGAMRYPFVVDFGPPSAGGWLVRAVASELQVAEASMLDVIEHQLILDDRRVDLTRLEFEVFRYLHDRRGMVVDRSSMLREIWGYDDPGGSNVIESLVTSLRRKLGDQASSIQTVRGLGYRFVPLD